MNQIFIKKFLVIIVLALVTMFSAGCDKLKILIHTKIEDDGSALRHIEYIFTPVDEDQLKYITRSLPDLLAKGFNLPSEPEWAIQKYIKEGSFYYVAERKFASVNNIKSDYFKKSQFNGASRNFVSFDLKDRLKSKEFNFLEIYKDSSDIIKFSALFTEYVEQNRTQIAQKLFKLTSKHIKTFNMADAQKIVDIFVDKSRRFNGVVSKFDIIGPHEIKMIDKELTDINKDIQIGYFIDYLADNRTCSTHSELIEFFHLYKTKMNETDKKKFYDELKAYVKEEFKAIASKNNIDPLGAYFTSLDMLNTYTFEYILEIPGDITSSNGNRITDNTIQWIFEPEDFFNHDYVIIAKSTLIKR